MTMQHVAGVDTSSPRREGVRRYTPHGAEAARMRGALIVDTRTETLRAEAGELPGAVVIDRTVFDWAPRFGERRADR